MAYDSKKLARISAFSPEKLDSDINFLLSPVEQFPRGSQRVDEACKPKPLAQFKEIEKHTYKLSADERYVTCYSGYVPIWRRSISPEEAKDFK